MIVQTSPYVENEGGSGGASPSPPPQADLAHTPADAEPTTAAPHPTVNCGYCGVQPGIDYGEGWLRCGNCGAL